ncbi:MAG: hypothetical protein GX654_10005 [Desulfatiglans sp.]|jgi:hypothetical protein|nr:hypothetical protein [Desulfatiglans sp.]
MLVNLKTCFIISIFIVFILPDFAVSGENKIEEQRKSSDKMILEKMHKEKCLPQIDERYSMMIFGLNSHSYLIDPGILAKNTLEPNVHAELRVINPYTKKEITWNRMPCFVSKRQELK